MISSGRNLDAKPSMKSLFAYTAAQCARRSASSSNFHRCKIWLIVPVSAWKYLVDGGLIVRSHEQPSRPRVVTEHPTCDPGLFLPR